MTIPDETIERAAEAVYKALSGRYAIEVPWETCDKPIKDLYESLALAALPILREAVIESIVASVERNRVLYGSPMFPYDITSDLVMFLRSYIPAESEPQP